MQRWTRVAPSSGRSRAAQLFLLSSPLCSLSLSLRLSPLSACTRRAPCAQSISRRQARPAPAIDVPQLACLAANRKWLAAGSREPHGDVLLLRCVRSVLRGARTQASGGETPRPAAQRSLSLSLPRNKTSNHQCFFTSSTRRLPAPRPKRTRLIMDATGKRRAEPNCWLGTTRTNRAACTNQLGR